MIYEGSRYQGGNVETLADRNGQFQVGVQRPVYTVSAATRQVVVAAGTRLDMLAAREWGDPRLWWAIADANPDLVWFDDLPAGTVLRIPSAPVR